MTTRPRLPIAPTAPIAALAELLDRAQVAPPAPPARCATSPELAADPDLVLRDYVLAPYPPRRDPRGGLASVNLLVESFAVAGLEDRGRAVLARLQAQLGVGLLVWGVKHVDGALSWEFYIYDPGQGRPEAKLDAVMAALDPLIAPVPRPHPAPPLHMWSLALDHRALATGVGAELTLYARGVDTPGASRSYGLVDGALELANLYTFHDPRRDPDAIRRRLEASVHLGAPARGLAAVVAPGLLRCRRVCVANKRRADGLYFAGIDTDEAVRFLADHQWPAALRRYLDGRRAQLGHLAWDVGLDFRAAGAEPTITKTAIYASC